jgi:hypothetical protein
VREFATKAAADGALVLIGSCDAVVRTPYGPFVEALDRLVEVIEPAELKAAVGIGGGELTRLVPDLALRVGDLPAPVDADPDTERHRLHTAVIHLLAAVSRERPVLLVVEDGHWADAPTLLLLRHLARAAGDACLLVLATFRDTDADVPQGLSETLADLRRSEAVERIRLGGLSSDEVAEFVRRAAGGDLGAELQELADALGDLTNGNPFLMCEALARADRDECARHIGRDGAEILRSPTELSSPKAFAGRQPAPGQARAEDSDLLELAYSRLRVRAGHRPGGDTARRAGAARERLGEAVRSGMLEDPHSPGRSYRFTHELVRRALYDRLSGMRRAELHLRVGEALEANRTPTGRTLPDLAHHFGAAVPFDSTGRGAEYNVLAARAAVTALAFDQAAARLHTALELGIDGDADRAEIYLELGNASHRAGKAADALEAFRMAAEIARELSDAELLAQAAIGYEDACWRPGIADQGAAELLAEAVTELGNENSSLRVLLLSGLARGLDFQGEHERGRVVRTNAIAMARELDDRRGLATVLCARTGRSAQPLEEVC